MRSKKRNVSSISPAADADNDESLLSKLRKNGLKFCFWPDDDEETGPERITDLDAMTLLVHHQSEFPVRVRREIRNASNEQEEEPKFFCERVHRIAGMLFIAPPALSDFPWRGLDHEVDTKDQVEVTLRFFPDILRMQGFAEINEKLTTGFILFWISMCEKSLPFAPLLAQLGVELDVLEVFQKWSFVRSILQYTPAQNDDEYDRKLDETALAVLKHLIEKGLLLKGNVEVARIFLLATSLRPSRIKKTLSFLLEWDTAVLQGGNNMESVPPLWSPPFNYKREKLGEEITIQRFRLMFERGMMHYPEEMGFMFHLASFPHELDFPPEKAEAFSSVFESMSWCFGTGTITKLVEEVLLNSTRGKPKNVQNLLVAIAAREDLALDAWYFLCRLNPAAVVPSGSP